MTEEELDISVRKPAEADAYASVQRANAERDAANAATEADAYKRTTIAQANKTAAIQDAEANAEAVRRAGEAERDRQVALAAGIRAEGEARAAATEAERHPANQSTPVFLAHGTQDGVVVLPRATDTRAALEKLGYAVEWHDYPMAHSVCLEEIADLGAFLRRVLARA